MSFLGARLAGREAAYFVEESRQTIARYVEKKPSKPPPQSTNPPSSTLDESPNVDVLPEILRHSLPPKILHRQPLTDYSPPVSTSTKWSIHSPSEESRVYGVSPDVLNPLKGYLVLPQVTFGPKRRVHLSSYQAGSSGTASTANELRRDQQLPLDPEKIKAAGEGLANIGKAFAGATAIVFGTAAVTFGLAASTLQVHNGDDIRVKGREFVQPKVDSLKDRMDPLRNWVDESSKKWHLETEQYLKGKPLIQELSKKFRAEQKAKSNVD